MSEDENGDTIPEDLWKQRRRSKGSFPRYQKMRNRSQIQFTYTHTTGQETEETQVRRMKVTERERKETPTQLRYIWIKLIIITVNEYHRQQQSDRFYQTTHRAHADPEPDREEVKVCYNIYFTIYQWPAGSREDHRSETGSGRNSGRLNKAEHRPREKECYKGKHQSRLLWGEMRRSIPEEEEKEHLCIEYRIGWWWVFNIKLEINCCWIQKSPEEGRKDDCCDVFAYI